MMWPARKPPRENRQGLSLFNTRTTCCSRVFWSLTRRPSTAVIRSLCSTFFRTFRRPVMRGIWPTPQLTNCWHFSRRMLSGTAGNLFSEVLGWPNWRKHWNSINKFNFLNILFKVFERCYWWGFVLVVFDRRCWAENFLQIAVIVSHAWFVLGIFTGELLVQLNLILIMRI